MTWSEAFPYFVLCMSVVSLSGSVALLILAVRLYREAAAMCRREDAQEEAFWEQRRQQGCEEAEPTDEPSSEFLPDEET